MSSVDVCVPWIETGCVHRARAKNWTAVHWWNLGIQCRYGESDERPLNRAQARNRAAEGSQADVLFFSDADMWVPEEQFREAVRLAFDTGSMVLAYEVHFRLNRWSTTKLYEGTVSHQGQGVRNCSSGCFAIRRDVYESLGGHDERFRGWGGEDRAFMFACLALCGVERIEGTSYHLWHPRSADLNRTTPERKDGLALAQRYKKAAGVRSRSGILAPTKDAEADPDAMRSILAEDGGPLTGGTAERIVSTSQSA